MLPTVWVKLLVDPTPDVLLMSPEFFLVRL